MYQNKIRDDALRQPPPPLRSLLPPRTEALFVGFLYDMRNRGHPLQKLDVRKLCYRYCKAAGYPIKTNGTRTASTDWFAAFSTRHAPVEGLISSRAIDGPRPEPLAALTAKEQPAEDNENVAPDGPQNPNLDFMNFADPPPGSDEERLQTIFRQLAFRDRNILSGPTRTKFLEMNYRQYLDL